MRQEWRETVLRALRAVVSRRGGVALGFWGAPGLGKTHAAAELLRALPCASLSLPASSPVSAFIHALPLPQKWPLWAQRHLERLVAGQPTDSAALVDTLVAALVGLSPFVLHLDDLHEADPQRTALITSLARAVAGTRGVGLLVSGRHEPPAPFVSSRLPPLSGAETGDLLLSRLNLPLPPEALEWLQERTRGNPLFVLEFTRYLTRQGSVWSDGTRWHWRPPPADFMPVTVEALIGQQLAELGRDAGVRGALEARAVLPDDLPGEQLDTVWASVAALPPSEVRAASGTLRRSGVLTGHDFSHPLYREVIVAGLLPETRQQLARRALGALAGDRRRAAAFVEAAGLEPQVALQVIVAAAQEADDLGRPAEAARLRASGVRYTSGAARLELALAAAQGLQHSDLPGALRLARLALDESPQHVGARALVAELLARQGDLAGAEEVHGQWPLPGRFTPAWWQRLLKLRGLADDQLGVLQLWEGRPELRDNPAPEVVATVARTLAQQGRMPEAAALTSRALDSSTLGAEIRGELIEVLGNIQYGRGEMEAAAQTFAQALALAREHGLRALEARCLVHRGVVLGDINRRREGLAELRAGLRLHADLGDGLAVTRAQVAVAEAHLDLGDYERAEELLLECRATLSRHGPSEHLIECEYRLSVLYRDWAPPHGGVLALRHAHAALSGARQFSGERKLAWSLCHAAFAEARFGDAARALALATEAGQLAQGMGNPTQTAFARFALAQAHEAAGQPEVALEQLGALEAELIAQGNLDAAQEVGLSGDRIAGRADRAAGRLAWFEAHDLVNFATLTRRAFPELAASSAPAPEPAPSPAPACLKVLGPVVVERGGERVGYRGRRRTELLAYLLEARLSGRAEVGTLELLDTFYPGEPEPQARATLRQQVYLIRTSVGAQAVLSTPTGYALGHVESDAEAFLGSGDGGLWRGPYLQGLGEGWLPRAREALTLGLRAQAERLSQGDPAQAARLGAILLEMEPYDEEALRLTLAALHLSGQPRSAAALYRQQRERHAEIGETLPESPELFLTPRAVG
ncbi:BTAD domain-containing putative transcriptional regulator [Deinococcus koreensis]|uniref:Bacterial transcriptional activator domain-containing protein n=1 Tax=Deinococcus koreensis TaxID=2054903 RepID=A0A2K3UT85_9DEIO|nr:AAA family ATPase [Deinococcus koreensis]PNY79753.1 hypothetical protein CVO96_17525 [Deinococcus koreensis]